MRFGLTVTSAAASEPVSLADARLHCRVDSPDEDPLLTTLIAAARGFCEAASNRALVTQTLRATYDRFPGPEECYRFRLPRAPAQSVSSITYLDTDEATQTVSTDVYRLDAAAVPAILEPKYGQEWPDYAGRAVAVTFVAGFGAASAVPAEFKQAILLLVGQWYRHREATGQASAEMEYAVKALLGVHAADLYSTGW